MNDTRSLTEWAQEETAAERLAQGLPATITEPLALDRLATILTSATPDASRGPAAAVEAPGIGAVGPRDTGIFGEVDPTVGSSGKRRPTAPLTKRTRPVAAGRVQDNAG